MREIDAIYQVFKDYYGEDRTDLKLNNGTYEIYIHWPSVTITNEFDESTDINNLYAKLELNRYGILCGNPTFLKSEYSLLHWKVGYIHSHIQPLYGERSNSNNATWRHSCLGSGPINRTISRLRTEHMPEENNEEYLNIWLMLCFELDKYIHTESVEGVPYFRISSIARHNSNTEIKLYPRYISFKKSPPNTLSHIDTLIKKFIKHIIKSNILKFNYINGNYSIGMSNTDLILTLSEVFIEWYNRDENECLRLKNSEDLFEGRIMQKVLYLEGNLYSTISANTDYTNTANVDFNYTLFTFKNNPVKLVISDYSSNTQINKINILHSEIIIKIIYFILRFINCNYGKDGDYKRIRLL